MKGCDVGSGEVAMVAGCWWEVVEGRWGGLNRWDLEGDLGAGRR